MNGIYIDILYLCIQRYLLRKYDWGMMTRGFAVPSQCLDPYRECMTWGSIKPYYYHMYDWGIHIRKISVILE